MYTKKEVRNVRFQPFVYDGSNQQVPVMIERMTQKDAELTNAHPLWQTSWTSEYLGDPRLEKYAAKVGDELIALAAMRYLKARWSSILCTWRHSRGQIPRSMRGIRSILGSGD